MTFNIEQVSITLTKEEISTLTCGLHYGMDWLRQEVFDDSLSESERDEYNKILQEVWELWNDLVSVRNL